MGHEMVLDEIEKLILKSGKKLNVAGPKPEALIKKAENELGVNFPESFKLYLKKWGVLRIGSKEYYGLVSEDFKNSGIPDIVWFNLNVRKKYKFPDHLIVFLDEADGDQYYCLDISKLNEVGECPIVLWDNIGCVVEDTIDINFCEFLKEDLEEYL